MERAEICPLHVALYDLSSKSYEGFAFAPYFNSTFLVFLTSSSGRAKLLLTSGKWDKSAYEASVGNDVKNFLRVKNLKSVKCVYYKKITACKKGGIIMRPLR